MKKIFKLIVTSFLSLMVIFSLASCADSELTEKEITENFNEEISKFSLSKASLNSYANSAVKDIANVDVDSIINSVNVPTSKITQTFIDEDNHSSQEVYMWQNGKKIYFGYYHDETDLNSYYLDLDYINQLFASVKPTEEDIDYVDLVLQLIANATNSEMPEINIDDYLGLIKLQADDFKYENGYFVFDKTSLLNFVSRIIPDVMVSYEVLATGLINSAVEEFKISIKYDGKHFNEFNVEIKLNIKVLISMIINDIEYINSITNDSAISLSLSIILDHDNDKLSGLHINNNFDAQLLNDEDPDLSYKAKLAFTFDVTNAEIKNTISGEFVGGVYSSFTQYDPTTDEILSETYTTNIYSYKINSSSTLNLVDKTLSSESIINVLQTEAVNGGEAETKIDLEVKLSISKTSDKLKLTLSLDDNPFIEEEINYQNNQIFDGKITVNYGVIEKINGETPSSRKYEIILETKDVVVPEALLNNENAISILENLERPAGPDIEASTPAN